MTKTDELLNECAKRGIPVYSNTPHIDGIFIILIWILKKIDPHV